MLLQTTEISACRPKSIAVGQSREYVESFDIELFSARMVLLASNDITVIHQGSNLGEEANECLN